MGIVRQFFLLPLVPSRVWGTSTSAIATPTKESLEEPAYVIQGIVCRNRDELPSTAEWTSIILEQPIVDIILAGAADHRQYPDPSYDSLVEALKDEDFKNYKELSDIKGFSAKNPTAFFIQHVYAATIGKLCRAD